MVTAALASLTLLLTGLRQVFGFREKWATMTWATVESSTRSTSISSSAHRAVMPPVRGWSCRSTRSLPRRLTGGPNGLRASGSETSGPPAVVE